MSGATQSRVFTALFDKIQPGSYMMHCKFDNKIDAETKLSLNVEQKSSTNEKIVQTCLYNPAIPMVASMIYQSGIFHLVDSDLPILTARLSMPESVEARVLSFELIYLGVSKFIEICFTDREKTGVSWLDEPSYYSIDDLFGKQTVHLKTVCWMDLKVNFGNITTGKYCIFWKIKLGPFSRCAIDECDSNVSATNSDDVTVSLVDKLRISFDPRCRNLQLIYGGEFDYDGAVSIGLNARLFNADSGYWKDDVYFDSAILVKVTEVNRDLKLSSIALKSFLESDFTDEDYNIAMKTIFPDILICDDIAMELVKETPPSTNPFGGAFGLILNNEGASWYNHDDDEGWITLPTGSDSDDEQNCDVDLDALNLP